MQNCEAKKRQKCAQTPIYHPFQISGFFKVQFKKTQLHRKVIQCFQRKPNLWKIMHLKVRTGNVRKKELFAPEVSGVPGAAFPYPQISLFK